jgi:ATP synthase in type III secretion protein N
MLVSGSVDSVRSGLLEVHIAGAAVGAGVRIHGSQHSVAGVVTAVRSGGKAIVAARGAVDGVRAGDIASLDPAALMMPLGTMVIGRSFDANGTVLDDGPPLSGRSYGIALRAPAPSQRTEITAPFCTGIRAIDGLLTMGRGARVGIFGPPGAGKSTLLQLLMRGSHADAIVITLVGERGREAHEWIANAPERASIVCGTGDRSAAERVHAARVGMAQAQVLRTNGLHVLLVLDSMARLAAALREVALASGEPSGRGGYPPSVVADLARYVEVAGTSSSGSITLIATVLSDGDERDPVSEAARSMLDGHIQLSAALAHAGCYPAIDVLTSASRTMEAVTTEQHRSHARVVRRAIAALARTADARALGIMPTDDFCLRALAREEALKRFLYQGKQSHMPLDTLRALADLCDELT